MLQHSHAFETPPLPIPAAGSDGRQDRAVRKVIGHMRDNLGEPHQLKELADIAYCSRWHLVRIFTERTGVSPMNFLSALRIQAAKTLLLTTDEKVIDIAYEVGYSSLGSFGKRFTSLVGMSPRALRNAAARFDIDRFIELIARMSEARRPVGPGRVMGGRLRTSYAAHRMDGHAFLGLFESGAPCGRPAQCAVAAFPGTYMLSALPVGRFTLLAAALPTGEHPSAVLLSDHLLLGRIDSIDLAESAAPRRADIELDTEMADKPPVLLALPLLLEGAARRRGLA